MTYQNPIIPGFHPDPSVCRVGEDYYLVTSSFEYFPGVPLFHSTDLVNWRQIGHCLTRKSQLDLTTCGPSGGIYAPTIRHHDGRFYLCTTNISGKGNFYVWTDDPEGEWSDPIWIDHQGIDPSLFFDDDDKVYYTGTGSGDDPQAIYGFQIDLATGKRLTEKSLLWLGTGGAHPEGPHLYKVNGWYYLIISEGGTEPAHMVTAARGKSPLGPFEPCPRNPLLTHRSLRTPVKSVGHSDLVQAQDGAWWAVCLGVRPMGYPEFHNLGRETYLLPVEWGDDGWPIYGDHGTLALQMSVPRGNVVQSRPEYPREEFDGSTLAPQWNLLYSPSHLDWNLSARPGFLTLNGSAVTLDDQSSPAFVGRRQEHHDFQASTWLEFSPSHSGEEAGLVVLMNKGHHYEVSVIRGESGSQLQFRRRIGSLWKVENALPCPEGPLVLGVDGTWDWYQFWFRRPDSTDRTVIGKGETRYLSTEVGGAFTGVYIGLFATGNGRRSASPAAFDWFLYQPMEDA